MMTKWLQRHMSETEQEQRNHRLQEDGDRFHYGSPAEDHERENDEEE